MRKSVSGHLDQRKIVELPFFSLAISKRVKPVDYRSPDGKLWVHVASPKYGMATIYVADILIYGALMPSGLARRGVNDIPRKLHLRPYALLRAIVRPTTRRAYGPLGQTHDRRVVTTIRRNICSKIGAKQRLPCMPMRFRSDAYRVARSRQGNTGLSSSAATARSLRPTLNRLTDFR